MSEQAIDAEHRPLAVVDEPQPQQNLALFGTSDPVAVIESAVRVADALKSVVVKKNLVSKIQGKDYPQVEAWQTLAVMLGLAAVCEWTRPVEGGWEARVIVQRHGLTIAAAEAQCLRSEKTKKSWEDYAIRSMAQTRATSKSLRSVLGFVMVLAGYEATPAEEMPGNTEPAAKATATTEKAAPAESVDNAATRKNGQTACVRYASNRKIPDEHRHEIAYAFFGKSSTKELDTAQLRKLYALLVAYVHFTDENGTMDADTFALWLKGQLDEARA